MPVPTILSLQPYYGGSHKAFMEGWQRQSQFKIETIELPPRHWKWRMRHSAWTMAEVANRLWESGSRWQVNFCSDMLNLAEFKGLARREIADLPSIIYFHENQFAYPNQKTAIRDLHFAITNFSSAMAADCVWFNSAFNRDSMFEQLNKQCEQWPDFAPKEQAKLLLERCDVIHPGIQPPQADRASDSPDEVLHLIWAARWEHDKGPDELLELLKLLEKRNFDFRVSVIGQSFRRVPKSIEQIKSRFAKRIVHWDFQESRQAYWDAIASADVYLSTAHHEFFGLSASEAISAGLYPVMPNRLAYPELLSSVPVKNQAQFLYDELNDAVELVIGARKNWSTFQKLNLANSFKDRFGDATQAKLMDAKIAAMIN